jgi:hypothetical protein
VKDPSEVKMSDDTRISIPLRNLISIIVGVSVSTWAYYGIIERLNAIESQSTYMLEEIEENDTWIDGFQPPPQVQDTVERVRELEIRIHVLETLLNK